MRFVPRRPGLRVFLLALPLALLGGGRADDRPDRDRAFFETKVRPVLEKHCLLCHGGARVRNGLEVTSREALLRGGDSGPAVVPGDPGRSLLIHSVRYEGRFPMPPKGRLPAEQVADLAEWVRRGAPWPAPPKR